MAEREGLEMLTFRAEILYGGFACPDEIMYSLVIRIWHPNCRQFARAMKSGWHVSNDIHIYDLARHPDLRFQGSYFRRWRF
jgi:hypothetical protein